MNLLSFPSGRRETRAFGSGPPVPELADGIHLVSSIPGRQRWQVQALRDQPSLAVAFQDLLAEEPGVQSATANPFTGRILVIGNVSFSRGQLRQLLHEAISALQRSAEAPALQVPPSVGPAVLVVAAGFVASRFVGALFAPILMAGAIVVATGVILTNPDPDRPGPSNLTRLYNYAQPHRRQIWLAIGCSVITKVLHFVPPFLIGHAVDVLVKGESTFIAALGVHSVAGQLLLLSGSVIVVWAVASFFEYTYRYWWRHLTQTVQHELQIHAYLRVQHAEMSFLESRSTGALATILNEDANLLETFFNDACNDAIQLITNVVVVGAVFIYLAPSVAWIALAPLPLVAWVSVEFRRNLGPLYHQARERAGMSDGQLVNNLTGIITIRSFTTEEYEAQRVRQLSENYLAVSAQATRLNAAFTPAIRMIVITGFAATMVATGLAASQGLLTPGHYAFLVVLTQRFLWPMTVLGQTIDLHQRAMAAAGRVLDLLEAPAALPAGGSPMPPQSVRGEITFDHVDFGYPGNEPVLRDFSLRIPAGQTIAFVGPTGAGKTTLIKLLLRFYEVNGGSIQVDGHDIRDVSVTDLRQSISLVSQDVFLFDGSIADNIRYGSFQAPMEAVRRAAQVGEAEEFILRLPAGYDTPVGERGLKLSGGQRQRLCIARAVLKNSAILLLDEATSSVDNETEAAIQRAIERIAVGRTVIIIAHRLSTVRNADTIYVLDKHGRVVQQGRHDDLVRSGGFYAALWDVQTGVTHAEPSD